MRARKENKKQQQASSKAGCTSSAASEKANPRKPLYLCVESIATVLFERSPRQQAIMPKKTRQAKGASATQRKLHFQVQDEEEVVEGVILNDDDKEEAGQTRRTSKKRSAPRPSTKKQKGSFLSPAKDRKSGAAVVTPGDEAKRKSEADDKEQYVPTYIYTNVGYSRRGEAEHLLTEGQRKAFAWIVQHCAIPRDMEQNRAHGPLSGSCYEERVLTAYRLGKLPRRDDDRIAETVICTSCGELGHSRDGCPTLV
jgi:hypothetical protein